MTQDDDVDLPALFRTSFPDVSARRRFNTRLGDFMIQNVSGRAARMVTVIGLLIAIVAGVTVAAPGAGAYTTSTDVVFVHGYGSCQDAAVAGAGPLQTQYYFQRQAAEKLHSISYYGCDTRGESIVGYGPRNGDYYPSPDGDYLNTSIRHFAYELAWYLYDKFTSQGLPVDLVGHSMGGLIFTYAMQRVKAQDPMFPPSLVVKTAVTFSTPFKGATISCSAVTTECQEFATTSPFIKEIQAGGAVQLAGQYTFWVLIGSTGCDVALPSTTEVLRGATWVVDYTSPCYTHVGYLWDSSNASDASGTLNGKAYTGGAHALAVMRWALL